MKKLNIFTLILFAIFSFSIAACNSSGDSEPNDESTDNETEQAKHEENGLSTEMDENSSQSNFNPANEIDPALVGVWDIKGDPVFGDVDEFLVVKENGFLKEGVDMAAGNPAFVKEGQIWYERDGNAVYLYDYKLDGENTLFFLEEKTAENKNPDASNPKVTKLTRR